MGDLNKQIGDRLYSVRIKLGLSQKEFGAQLGGYSRQMIGNYETGKVPLPLALLKECFIKYQVDSDFLLGNRPYSIPQDESVSQIMNTLRHLDREKLLIAKGMLKSSFREVI
ncbi:MAG: helix-turn-helix transcriptional regulator [Cyclobacteriaceae bacterium]